MSELNNLRNMEKTVPAVSSTVKTVLGAFIGNRLAKGKGSSFTKRETKNRMIDREHEAYVKDQLASKAHTREMQKSQQFHNQGLEAKRFEADTIHEIASRYPHATDVQHGGTKVRFGKRQSSSPKPKTEDTKPKTPKPPSNKGNKRGKGKTK